ncbi:MAG: prepilin-type N-terminal cleavage/methylation domain-containing protein [candidate division NC10 bacterium]|nr:prepilin-type N-terminal cleavage/methylation domain-containing protein [candidate division NC10 bacterium]
MRGAPWRLTTNSAGLTFIELLVVLAVLAVLAAVAMPLAEVTVKRSRELELRRGLREVREGIDRFKVEYDKARGNAKDKREVFVQRVSVDRTGYPPDGPRQRVGHALVLGQSRFQCVRRA